MVPSDGTLVYKPYSKLAIAISEITGYFYGMRNMNYKWGDLLVLITGITGAITVEVSTMAHMQDCGGMSQQ